MLLTGWAPLLPARNSARRVPLDEVAAKKTVILRHKGSLSSAFRRGVTEKSRAPARANGTGEEKRL